jgi:REP element-mobilizing transposase RayT
MQVQASATPRSRTTTSTRPDAGSEGFTAHFLTVATLFRRPLFLDAEAARAVARCQPEASIWGRAGCLAWVLMPDRWHGLVLTPADEPLDALVRRFKGITARTIDPRFCINGWLWSRGYNQRTLERHEDRLAVARHLVSNPVRAGLARSVGAYPYWDAIWLGGQAPGSRAP